jgi:hypothetical protein
MSAVAIEAHVHPKDPVRTTAIRLLPWGAILLAPFLGVLFLRAPIVNALPYRDPWFYSGYGWTLSHHIEVFGWFYYADRFTVILPIAWSTAIFGPVVGYITLRYVILVATSALLYACVRRFSSIAVACAAVCLLTLDPFYLRLVLWDYTTFIALPCTIAASAVWHLGSTRVQTLWTALATGIFLGAAVYANPLSGLAIPALFGVEIVAALRKGWSDLILLVMRAMVALGGGLLLFVAGYLGYRIYLGSFSPRDLVNPTLEFFHSNNQRSAPFQKPMGVWLKGEPRIYGPVLVCMAVVVILGRDIFHNTLRARVAQFAVAYTLIFWIYRFAVTSAVIEVWWAYSMTAVTTAFGIPVILDAITDGSSGRSRLIIGSVLAATAATDFVVRVMGGTAVSYFDEVRTHAVLLLLVLVAAGVAALAVSLMRSTTAQLAALVTFCVIVAVVSLTPANYLGISQTGEFSPDGKTELYGYEAAYDMTRLIASKDRPPSRALLWSTLTGLADIGWANLPHQEGGIENVEAPLPLPLSELTPPELELLRYPTTRRVLILSKDLGEVNSALLTLRRQGFQPRIEQAGAWADRKLHYELVEL